MNPSVSHQIQGRCSNPSEVARIAALYGLALLDDAGVSLARELACRLVPGEVAPAATFQAVQRAAGAAVFGFHEAGVLTGVLAAFPLNAKGLEQLTAGGFDALNLDIDLVSRPGQLPGAYYGWGFAASTKDAGRSVVKASVQIHRELYWATPTFARAVTPDGLRALTSIGFRPVRADDEALLWIAPNLVVASR
jgi:hypothetical protein